MVEGFLGFLVLPVRGCRAGHMLDLDPPKPRDVKGAAFVPKGFSKGAFQQRV